MGYSGKRRVVVTPERLRELLVTALADGDLSISGGFAAVKTALGGVPWFEAGPITLGDVRRQIEKLETAHRVEALVADSGRRTMARYRLRKDRAA